MTKRIEAIWCQLYHSYLFPVLCFIHQGANFLLQRQRDNARAYYATSARCRERSRLRGIKRRESGAHAAACRKYRKRQGDAYKKRQVKREAARRKSDPYYRLLHRVRTRLYLFARNSGTKRPRRVDTFGCTQAEFRAHIEKLFKDGMTWANYGEWHLDHIRPCASFNLSDETQLKQCFHFSNLQPLWAVENMQKGDLWTKAA